MTALETRLFTVDETGAGQRVDQYLAFRMPERTRTGIQKFIAAGLVTMAGRPLKKNDRLQNGAVIAVTVPDPVPDTAAPQAIALDIVYEDNDLLVVNKPKGMVVHPAAGNRDGTLVNALLHHCAGNLSGIGGVLRPGIVHRIDKDTSGLLLVAKNDKAHQSLARQIKEHTFTRIYEAVVYGRVSPDSGTIDAPVGRHPVNRKRMAVVPSGRAAVTHYEVLARYAGFTRVCLRLETGRTHQIRVHMASIGHPLAGDPVYGPKKVITTLAGQCLHARVVGFCHPRDGAYMECTSDLPPYFLSFLRGLGPEQ